MSVLYSVVFSAVCVLFLSIYLFYINIILLVYETNKILACKEGSLTLKSDQKAEQKLFLQSGLSWRLGDAACALPLQAALLQDI